MLCFPVISIESVFVSSSLGVLCSTGSSADVLLQVKGRAVLLLKEGRKCTKIFHTKTNAEICNTVNGKN